MTGRRLDGRVISALLRCDKTAESCAAVVVFACGLILVKFVHRALFLSGDLLAHLGQPQIVGGCEQAYSLCNGLPL
jgi:hypothetical protein